MAFFTSLSNHISFLSRIWTLLFSKECPWFFRCRWTAEFLSWGVCFLCCACRTVVKSRLGLDTCCCVGQHVQHLSVRVWAFHSWGEPVIISESYSVWDAPGCCVCLFMFLLSLIQEASLFLTGWWGVPDIYSYPQVTRLITQQKPKTRLPQGVNGCEITWRRISRLHDTYLINGIVDLLCLEMSVSVWHRWLN